MKNLIFILVAVIFSSCSSYDYKITSLEFKKLNFDELPLEVKEYLSNPPDPIGDSYKMLVLIDLTDSVNYSLETVETCIGPWVNYQKLIDKQKKVSYRINRGVPDPYIVFKNKLYIPDRYNIISVESARKAIYTEYQLK